jgi:hypothetical protein
MSRGVAGIFLDASVQGIQIGRERALFLASMDHTQGNRVELEPTVRTMGAEKKKDRGTRDDRQINPDGQQPLRITRKRANTSI